MTTRFYTLIGRAVWALGKRRAMQKVHASPRGVRVGMLGAFVIGIVGLGAFAARSRAT